MHLISFINLFVLQFAIAGGELTLGPVCEKLVPKCDVNELMVKIRDLEKLSDSSITEKIENAFYVTSSSTVNGATTWSKVVSEGKLELPKQLIEGGASPEEAVFLSTFYKDFSQSTLGSLPVFQDRLRLYRFQFKTKRNKTDCMKIQMDVNKGDICKAAKLCSIACEELDSAIFDLNRDVNSSTKKTLSNSR